MREALKDYGGGDENTSNAPVQEKSQLFVLVDEAITQTERFCLEKNIDLQALLSKNDVFKNIANFKQYADNLLSRDEWRKSFAVYSNTVLSLYEACKPEILNQEKRPLIVVIQYFHGVIDSIIEQTDINQVSIKIAELLDQSLVVKNDNKLTVKESSSQYQIVQKGKTWDLSKINFEKLRTEFKAATYKHIEITDLRVFIERKLELMMQQNVNRTDFGQRLQEIINKYNAGTSSTENYFSELMDFAAEMKAETERHIRVGLTEDELELFDTLKKEKMTKNEEQKVKLAAQSLLYRLLEENPKVLVQDW